MTLVMASLILVVVQPGEPTSAQAAPVAITIDSYRIGVAPQQVQTLVVSGVGGSFSLRFAGGVETEPIALNAPACVGPGGDPVVGCDPASVQGRLARVGKWATVTDGPDGLTPPTPAARYTVSFTDPAASIADTGTASLIGGLNEPASASVECVFCLDDYGSPPVANGAAVLMVHGGGMVAGSKADWKNAAPLIAAAGYRTFSMNYRLLAPPRGGLSSCSFNPLAPGAPVCATWRASIDAATDDVRAATAWIRSNATRLGVDPSRVAVLGFSAGGTLALHALYGSAASTGVPSAAVAVSGVMDTRLASNAAGPALLLTRSGVDIAYAGGFLAPVDAQVEAEAVVSAARAAGNLVLLRSYPGAGHDLGPVTDVWSDVATSISDFLRAHVVDPSAPTRVGGTWLGDYRGLRTGPGQQRGSRPQDHPRPVVGDFNGDRIDDVIWYAPGAAPDSIWFGGADGTFHDPIEWTGDYTTYHPAIDVGGSYQPVVTDLNHDGRDDIIWISPTDGLGTMLWFGRADGTFTQIPIGDIPVGIHAYTGDFNGDGSGDILLWWPAMKDAALIYTTPVTGYEVAFLVGGLPAEAVPLMGDFDGDGRTDVFWAAGASSLVWYSSGLVGPGAVAAFASPAPAPTNLAAVGDFDGDRRDDLAWFSPSGPGELWYGSPVRATFDKGRPLPKGRAASVFDLHGDGIADLVWFGDAQTQAIIEGTRDRTVGFNPRALPTPVGSADLVVAGSFHTASPSAGGRTDLVWYWNL